MTIRKIQLIESILFFIISNLIMLLGADYPPPIGFLWITFISAVLSILQFYLLIIPQYIHKLTQSQSLT